MLIVVACALTLITLFGIGAAASSTSVVANGSFESPSVSTATTMTGTQLSSWDIGASRLKLVPGSVWAAEQGSQSIELFGTGGPSALSQTLATAASHVYTITFWYGANPNAQGSCGSPAIEVLWNDTRVGNTAGYTANPPKKGGTVGWTSATIQVAATATSSKLGFRSLDSTACTAGMAVDDVSVVDSQGTPSLDGVGMMTVTPTAVASSTTTSFLFHYGADPNASPNPKLSNGILTIDVPNGWTAPQTAQSNGAWIRQAHESAWRNTHQRDRNRHRRRQDHDHEPQPRPEHRVGRVHLQRHGSLHVRAVHVSRPRSSRTTAAH